MLDIDFIRENPDQVQAAAKNRQVAVDIDRLIELDDQRRELTEKVNNLRHQRNELSKSMEGEKPPEKTIKKARKLKSELSGKEENLNKILNQYYELLYKIPNVYSDDTPVGPDESGNEVLRRAGEPREFDFEPKDHLELGEELNLIDTEQAAQVSGARFAYLKGKLVLMEFALHQWVLDTLTSQTNVAEIIEKNGLEAEPTAFIPVLPPDMVREEVFEKTGRKEPVEDKYFLQKDELFLAGSAEHALAPIHMDQILELSNLPLRYLGFSTAFRREAGSYGQDTRGILRMHQFNKMEMQSFTVPDKSLQEQQLMVAIQEHFMQQLDIPYQVVAICSGDMGQPTYRQIDIETWIPTQNKYRETHTADLNTDYQARRLNIRYRREEGETAYVHMNDATALANTRTLIAILENYQTADGKIRVPEVLQPYLNFEVIG